MSGALFMQAVQRSGAVLLPIDSEHNAIFQCLPGDYARGLAQAELEHVTPEQACAHPNWSMGRKISVDSASMMNKGLELIEACWLFDARPAQVEVVVHPQSVIHSLVDYVDGSVLAQLGNPDMRTPIANALAWPQRIDSGVAPLDLFARRIRFPQIPSIIEHVLNQEAVVAVPTLEAKDMSALYMIIGTLVALGVLVTFHEFGHFWVARRCGVKVLRFSVGFGMPLVRWHDRHGTEFVVAAIPLGGYVKMLDEREGEVPADQLEQSFNRKSVRQRIAIVAAGPIANFLLAIVFFWALAMLGSQQARPVIGAVEAGSL
uniref:1-deoxy-D-xylulose-5-phosphate reductoisomerase n=1 Tax=Steinernema glaseri TaxID=37863 RepID=A0A1I7YI71_9BILA